MDESQQCLNAYAKEQGYLHKTQFTITGNFDWSLLTNCYAHDSLFQEERSYIDLRFLAGKLSQESSTHILQLIHTIQTKKPPFLLVISFYQLSWQDKKAAWFRTLQQHAVCVDCAPITPSALPTWITRRLRTNHQSADPEAITCLIDNHEGHLLALQQELTQLSIAFPAGHLSTSDILSFSTRCAQYTLQEDLSRALLLQDEQRFQTVLHALREQGVAPPFILWRISEDLRQWLRLAHHVAEKMPWQQALRTCHIFFTKQAVYEQAFTKLDARRVEQALRFCFWIDLTIKGVPLDSRNTESHWTNPWDAFLHMRQLLF